MYRLPQILSVGFIDSQTLDEVISIEQQDCDDSMLSYKIEEDIDIVQFVKEVG